uniref:C2H2-type domain-containing protein n=1 Tax=Panagrellus redivivus TaxID=6233 RepID=A0A7E4VW92_PANRE
MASSPSRPASATDSDAGCSPEPGVQRLLELTLAKCLDQFSSSSNSPNEDNDMKIPVYPHKHREERKRRRIIGNSDNTLDGLVAKRADVDPNAKRYQTETEAIELPDDEVEMKRLETDPDVSTRMCSICGYQGKWVSEMIRHKRVHTNERPFKCKYCNRTSKWKADLIRHVAKTHGIRVVSKYSRSKAFDMHSDIKEEVLTTDEQPLHIHATHSHISKASPARKHQQESPGSSVSTSSTSASPVFRCLVCFFEQESVDALISHLHAAHGVSPFECVQCKRTFNEVSAASGHCATPSACTPLSIKINFSPVYSNKSASSCLSSSATTSSPCSSVRSASESDGTASALSCRLDDIVGEGGSASLTCSDCPFRVDTEDKLHLHRMGHETPKGLMTYKCAFCNWYNKKKGAIEQHMALHTPRPEEFMSQVERNLITPAMMYESVKAQQNAATMAALAANPLLAAGFPMLGATAPTSLDLSSMFSAAAGLYSPMAATPQSMPDLSALSSLSVNPLLAFGLCSLLDMQKNANLLKFEPVS